MRKLAYLLTFLILGVSLASRASHAAGGYFEYTCLGNNVYQVDYFFLRDCDGSDYAAFVTYRLNNSCGTNCEDMVFNAPLVEETGVDYGCGPGCDSPRPSFEMAHYRRLITLPAACADWKISVSIVARNTVDYVGSTGSTEYYNYCIINNTNGLCNNSVRITGQPVALGCTGYDGRSMYNVTSPAGNTLVYDFVTPMVGTCDQPWAVTYSGSTSTVRPFPATADFALSSNGTFTFVPTAMGTSYFAVRVREYQGTVLVGTSIIDGMVLARSCDIGGPIHFSDWADDDDNSYSVNGVGLTFCRKITLEANANNDEIGEVTVAGTYVSGYQVTHNDDGSATVNICVQFPPELLCQPVDALIIVTANTTSAECLSHVLKGVGSRGYYHVLKNRGDYCPDNLFFTNRNPDQTPMPAFARAEQRIWVGDSMPAIAPPMVPGPVIIDGNVELVAGIEVVIPACQDPAIGCVSFTEDLTIRIDPLACNSECVHEPLSLSVKELFECHDERLIAQVTGEAPFTYNWTIDGNTISTTSAEFNIHDIVSTKNAGQVPYSVEVFDAVGASGTFSGSILGTQKFYEPILNNKIWFNYPQNHPYGNSGYYYSANLGVYSHTPAYIIDSVNTNGPWYGATEVDFIVWDRWGGILHELYLNLEGLEDWSIDNGQIWWGGTQNNLGVHCPGSLANNNTTVTFNYTLRNRNCYNTGNIEIHNPEIDETGAFTVFACTEDPWVPAITKSGNDYSETQYPKGASRNTFDFPASGEEGVSSLSLQPNPATDEFQLIGTAAEFGVIRIVNQLGDEVLKITGAATGDKINISALSAGMYVVLVDEQPFKLVKK